MSDTGTELGHGKGAAVADPRGNMRQVAGEALGQPSPAANPGTLAEALIRLQASLPRITKDDTAEIETKTGRKFGYRYANLASITDAIRPLLCELGLLWTCKPTLNHVGQFILAYQMKHVPSGEADGGEWPLPTTTPQTMGGAITYARRYSLNAYINLAPAEDDDDAAAAEKASYEDRVAAGRMSREQMREHGQLERNVKSSPRKAERVSAHDREADYSRPSGGDDDPWASDLEDTPGSIDEGQRRKIMGLFTRAGITDRADRLAYAMSKLDLPELATSNDLSYRQALSLIEHLEGEKP